MVASMGVSSRPRREPSAHWWHGLPREELLSVRIRDLGLRIEGTPLEACVERLNHELEQAGLRFRPHVWLSTDWFTPDGVIGFAIPFFLADARLTRLERAQMYEVEGEGKEGCMKLLRHETGHAIDNAYRLRRRKAYREVFGSPSVAYRDWYAPRPASRDHVQHLDQWYAQSHPVEDFAETFAVWLSSSRKRWARDYADWPALRKLELVDEVMRDVATEAPVVKSRACPDPVSRVGMTLREYYERKKAHYSREAATAYDRLLRRVFREEEGRGRRRADTFLKRHRPELRERIAELSGQHRYVVDQVLRALIVRCRELDLFVDRSDTDAHGDAAILVTALTMRFLSGGRQEYQR